MSEARTDKKEAIASAFAKIVGHQNAVMDSNILLTPEEIQVLIKLFPVTNVPEKNPQ